MGPKWIEVELTLKLDMFMHTVIKYFNGSEKWLQQADCLTVLTFLLWVHTADWLEWLCPMVFKGGVWTAEVTESHKRWEDDFIPCTGWSESLLGVVKTAFQQPRLQIAKWDGKVVTNNGDYLSIWKEVVAYFKALNLHSTRNTNEHYRKPE
jgi:hypothetical protein